MRIHSPYRTETDGVKRFLCHYHLSSVDEMKQKVVHLAYKQYGLTIRSFDFFKPGCCLRVSTGNGPYFFKAFDSDINSDINELMRAIDYLREEGVPLSEVLETKQGKKATEFQGRPAYFAKEVEGMPVSVKEPEQLRQMAEALAAFHAAGEKRYARREKPNGSLLSRHRLLDDIRLHLKKAEIWLGTSEGMFDESGLTALSKAHSCLKNGLPEKLFLNLPKTYIHGDFKPDHVFQKDGRITGIIDFDFAGWGERLRDVESMALSLSHDGGDNPTFDKQTLFIREYQEHIPLTDAELNALPWLQLWGNYFRVSALSGWRNRGVNVPSRRIADAVSDLKNALKHVLRNRSFYEKNWRTCQCFGRG